MPKTRIQKCGNCGGKVGPNFYVVKMSQAIVDYGAVSRQQGLAQMLGSSSLADVMSPIESLEHIVQGQDANKWPEIIICNQCLVHSDVLYKLFMKGADDSHE